MKLAKFSTYALGAHTRELTRLGIQHGHFADRTKELYASASFQRGETVVDLGSGPGFNTLELAQIVGKQGTVFAIDSSEKSIETLVARAKEHGYEIRSQKELIHRDFGEIRLCCGDASSPEVWEALRNVTVDRVWCRWLLTWLPQGEVKRIHDHLATHIRIGGTVAVHDYFNVATFEVCSPNADGAPLWRHLRDVLLNEWLRVGDPSVCSKIPQWLHERNFQVKELKPLAPIVRPIDEMWEWPATYFNNQARRLVDRGVLPSGFVEDFEVEWDKITQDPSAWYCPPMMATLVAERRGQPAAH